MAPSKAWMNLVDERLSTECLDGLTSKKIIYLDGVAKFLDYAFNRLGNGVKIRCPCIKCCNTYNMSRDVVYSHLTAYGIIKAIPFGIIMEKFLEKLRMIWKWKMMMIHMMECRS